PAQMQTTGLLLLLLAFGSISLAADPQLDSALEEKLPSPWVKSFDVRSWVGYKDNVLLSNQNIVRSPFLAGSADITLLRLQISDWEALVFASGEYVRYLSAKDVDHEATVIFQSQLKRSFGSWKVGLS